MAELGVNIDHVATVRQARKTYEPDPVWAAALAELGGADQITIHLREDRRHIQDTDVGAVRLVTQKYDKPLNLEMGAHQEIMEIAVATSPDWVCLVPEKREEKTTEGGLDILSPTQYEKILAACQFLKDNILDPLHMNDTHFYVPEEKKDRVATVYSLEGEKISLADNPGKLEGWSHVGQGHYINGPRISFAGGAGLVSTTQDYGTFLQMILNGGELNGTRILSRKSIELMTQNHLGDIPYGAGRGFGLGFEIITDLGDYGKPGSQGAYGWGGAYHSTYWIDPKENIVFVYLTQLIPADGIDDADKLRSLIYQAIVD